MNHQRHAEPLPLGSAEQPFSKGLMARANANTNVIHDWVAKTPWIANLAEDPATASNTSVCLQFSDRSDEQGVACQHEPRLISSAFVRDQQTDAFRSVPGRVQHLH